MKVVVIENSGIPLTLFFEVLLFRGFEGRSCVTGMTR